VELFADAVIHYEDTQIYTKGNHTMHFGFQGYRYRVDTFYSGNNGEAGTILFNGFYTTSAPGQVPPSAAVLAAPRSRFHAGPAARNPGRRQRRYLGPALELPGRVLPGRLARHSAPDPQPGLALGTAHALGRS
jgi:hypothetical protein